ncbi:MAG: ABC transporter permease [Candidatus Hydrothermarchaeota archaeon]|nr:ABC transporter permease [Candidatus Hydrothermarchaeota archaeon]
MKEYLIYSVRSLSQQKTRTFLTLLGMIVGIAVIIAMVSIGEGMRVSISKEIGKVGGDVIFVFPGGFEAHAFGPPAGTVPFTDSQLQDVRYIPGVKSAYPVLLKAAVAEYKGEKQTVSIRGTESGASVVFSKMYSIKEGRLFRDYEDGVVLGYRAAKNVFSREIRTGDSVKIEGKSFRVVGIFQESGNNPRDTIIFMPLQKAQPLFNAYGEITGMFVLCDSENVVDQVAKKIEDVLEKMRGGKDFDVITSRQMAEQIAQITTIVSFVLGGIASVSILVGGVIIMNTMLMSVMERTREIGVMKATGATNSLILSMFLIESGLVGIAGGTIGIVLGAVISKIIEYAGRLYIGGSFATVITQQMVLGAIFFSLFIGCASGAYPAYRASKLDPVEALRYE